MSFLNIGCQGQGEAPQTEAELARPAPQDPSGKTAIDARRCRQNRAAGKITFLTSYGFAATTGIMDVVTAKDLGYFDALCLSVDIRPGGTNAQLVSAGTAQLAGFGDAASLMVAVQHGASLTGIATYGNTSAVELISMARNHVHSPHDLVGKIVGYKVALPPQVAAMFVKSGVSLQEIKFVSVGYNPVSLSNGSVYAITGYRTNEPRVLTQQGFAITELDPEAYGVHSTFSIIMANPGFARQHPTAVADFLRATLHAYGWIQRSNSHLDQALGFVKLRAVSGFDLEASRYRWSLEEQMIRDSQKPGTYVGWNDPSQWQAEAQTLVDAHLITRPAPSAPLYDNHYLESIYNKEQLIWPAR